MRKEGGSGLVLGGSGEFISGCGGSGFVVEGGDRRRNWDRELSPSAQLLDYELGSSELELEGARLFSFLFQLCLH